MDSEESELWSHERRQSLHPYVEVVLSQSHGHSKIKWAMPIGSNVPLCMNLKQVFVDQCCTQEESLTH